MLIKAVFFDWYNTLAYHEPLRQVLYSQAFQRLGIELTAKDVIRGILAADRYCLEENAKSPLRKRSRKEQFEVYLYYPRAILAEAGVEAPQELPEQIMKIVIEQFEGATLALFDDVLSTLDTLTKQNLILGMITNAAKDTLSVHRKLGLEPYLDFVVTPEDAGADKPEPLIFQAALDRAGVSASEAAHIGDQYELDIVGARGVGIKPILIDRYDLYPEVSDCPRIESLTELAGYL